MPLRCGLVGLPNAGKSTLFNALTASEIPAENYPFCTIDPNVGIAEIRDPRLARLAEISGSERVIPATVQFTDIAGLVKGASDGEGLGNKFLGHIRETDAVVHVVRCFAAKDVAHVGGAVDPVADIELVDLELALADLSALELALGKAESKARAGDAESRSAVAILDRAKAALERGMPLRRQGLDGRAAEIIGQLFPLTMKPVLYVANNKREDPEAHLMLRHLKEFADENDSSLLVLDAKLESELSLLDAENRAAFLEEYGIEFSGLDRLAQATLDLLGLQVFFTSGPKESRAWVIPKGVKIAEAAGHIHTDMQKGFIKAEVVAYEDFIEHGGVSGAKEAGRLRLEGKNYGVREGDILHVRFNA